MRLSAAIRLPGATQSGEFGLVTYCSPVNTKSRLALRVKLLP